MQTVVRARALFSLLWGFGLLSAASEVGGRCARYFSLPIPGPVLGLLALVVVLILLGRVPEGLRLASELLIRHLNLFYIPAAIGVVAYAHLVQSDLLPILIALIPGTWLALGVTAWVFQTLSPNENDPSTTKART